MCGGHEDICHCVSVAMRGQLCDAGFFTHLDGLWGPNQGSWPEKHMLFTNCAVLLALDPNFLVITFQWNGFHVLEQDIPGTVKYLYLKGTEEELSYLKKCSNKQGCEWPVLEEKGAYEGTHGL